MAINNTGIIAELKQTAILLLLTRRDDTETLRLVQRSSHTGYFACLSLDGSKQMFVWACGPADSIGIYRVTFGIQIPRIWNVTSSVSVSILLAAYYIAIILIIIVVINSEHLTRNISCS
jgi:hypothetical protein